MFFNVTFQDGTVINSHMDCSVYELAKLQAKHGAIKTIEACEPVRKPQAFANWQEDQTAF